MKQLANNVLRAKNMTSLLVNMGIDLQGREIVCTDESIIINLEGHSDVKQLTADIQSLLHDSSKSEIKRVTLAELISAEITTATCSDQTAIETHKKSCLAIFNILQMQGLEYKLDEAGEQIEINLPNPIYAQLFGCLNYQYMHTADNQIKFDLKKFLQNNPEDLCIIEGTKPHLFIKAKAFEKKQVFYAQKRLANDEVEVTPYFFVPNAACPPQYHFALDTSSSMDGTSLATLKKSVVAFATSLFDFQPEAKIKITEFNTEITTLGTYGRQQLSRLQRDVQSLTASGSTCLYKTTLEQLQEIQYSGRHNNILLFTDGENSSQDEPHILRRLDAQITVLRRSNLITARNKFFIVSYGVTQPEILHEVTNLFASPVLDTNTADFVMALSEQQKMQEWAAVRELFTCRFEIIDSTRSEAEQVEYVRAYDMSGQFAALEPRICKENDTMNIRILDGDGKVILEDVKLLSNRKTPVVQDKEGPLTSLSIFKFAKPQTDSPQTDSPQTEAGLYL